MSSLTLISKTLGSIIFSVVAFTLFAGLVAVLRDINPTPIMIFAGVAGFFGSVLANFARIKQIKNLSYETKKNDKTEIESTATATGRFV